MFFFDIIILVVVCIVFIYTTNIQKLYKIT